MWINKIERMDAFLYKALCKYYFSCVFVNTSSNVLNDWTFHHLFVWLLSTLLNEYFYFSCSLLLPCSDWLPVLILASSKGSCLVQASLKIQRQFGKCVHGNVLHNMYSGVHWYVGANTGSWLAKRKAATLCSAARQCGFFLFLSKRDGEWELEDCCWWEMRCWVSLKQLVNWDLWFHRDDSQGFRAKGLLQRSKTSSFTQKASTETRS